MVTGAPFKPAGDEARAFTGEVDLNGIAAELLSIGGTRTVVDGGGAWNPVFDVTPAALIDAIVTERGVIERPDAAKMQAMFGTGA